MKILSTLIAAFATIATICGSTWATIVYNNKPDFLSAVSGFDYTMESFESFTPVDTELTTLGLTDFTITQDGNDRLCVRTTSDAGGAHATDGTRYVWWEPSWEASSSLTLSFDDPIRFFGLYVTDAMDWTTSGPALSISNRVDPDYIVVEAPQTSGLEVFWGIVSSYDFDIVTLTTSGLTGRDVVGIDEVYYGVPEPATMLMLGCLGTGILATRKSRRKR